jgi:RNA 2',3'-cyclic 3'-phosphodiesterase
MMRLFVAIDLDELARSAIAAEQARLRAETSPSPARWVRPEQLHLTLVFIGQASDPQAAALREAFGAPIAMPPFEMTFGGLGAFPPHGAPRALWIAVQDGTSETVALQREVAARARGLGVALEARPFSPHLTIARCKDARPSDRRRLLASAGDERRIARVAVDHATLYHSRPSPAGSIYTPLARANLIESRA